MRKWRSHRWRNEWVLAYLCLALAGCEPSRPASLAANKQQPVHSASGGLFEDVTEAAKITFRHTNGKGDRYIFLQTLGGGCAFLDYNNDGHMDIALVSCGDFPPTEPQQNIYLYRNQGNGAFDEVTRGSGLDVDCRYAQGIAIGDIDNDGRPDLFITAYGGCRLFRNETIKNSATATFRDITKESGVGDTDKGLRWASSAAFGDYDNDGRLDLYVCHYTIWNPQIDKRCPLPGGTSTYCNPTVYDADSDRLYRNTGGGMFEDVSKTAGIARLRCRGLAVAWLDYNGDGFEDVYVANDMDPNMLLKNNGNRTFTDVAVETGVAFGANGTAQSGMGIAVGDYENSGRESLLVTNLNGQFYSLFRNDGMERFSYATEPAGIGLHTFAYSGFGTEFLDYDRDGRKDLVTGNGHINPDIDRYLPGVTYEEPKALFHNEGYGEFRQVNSSAGDMVRPRSTRGLATGDYDNDGKVDVLCVNRNARADLFRNVSPDTNHWISVRLVGVRSNRDGAGTKVRVTANGRRQYAEARLSSSYASSSDPRLFFGLGKASSIDRLELRWPNGQKDVYKNIRADRFLVCTEGRGAH